MSPHEGHGRARWVPESHVDLGTVWLIPELFRQESSRRCKAFNRPDERCYVASGSQLVVTALARQQWPSPSLAPPNKGPAVFSLSVSVVVVTVPARAEGGVYFEHGVDDPQGIHNDRIIGLSDSITH